MFPTTARRGWLAGSLAVVLAAAAFASSETPPEGPPWKRDLRAAQTEAVQKGLPIFVYLTKTY